MGSGIDALLIFSFGGPEGPDEVLPFLRRVVAGRGVPEARLAHVAENYDAVGGRSPINAANRALVRAVEAELRRRGLPQRVYFGNRHAPPYLADANAAMAADGVQDAAVFVTSAYGSYSGCRSYLEALEADGSGIRFHKLRLFFDHPGFLGAVVARVRQAMAGLVEPRLVFTGHSIPTAFAATSPYVEQIRRTCGLVASDLGVDDFDLVWQSRSGPPHVPWLEPDVSDFLAALPPERPVVLVPIGFLCDHMEVIWDLDRVAAGVAEERGIALHRAGTPQDHPAFVAMVADLLQERTDPALPRPARGGGPPWPDACPPGCCAPPRR